MHKKLLALIGVMYLTTSMFALDALPTLTSFLDSVFSRDYEKAYSYVSIEDKEEISEEQFANAIEKSFNFFYFLIDIIKENTTYIVLDAKEEGSNKINASILINSIDLKNEEFNLRFSNALSRTTYSQNVNDIIDQVNVLMKGVDIPLKSYNRNNTLLLEEDGWKIDLDTVGLSIL